MKRVWIPAFLALWVAVYGRADEETELVRKADLIVKARTVALLPEVESIPMKFWYSSYDLNHRLVLNAMVLDVKETLKGEWPKTAGPLRFLFTGHFYRRDTNKRKVNTMNDFVSLSEEDVNREDFWLLTWDPSIEQYTVRSLRQRQPLSERDTLMNLAKGEGSSKGSTVSPAPKPAGRGARGIPEDRDLIGNGSRPKVRGTWGAGGAVPANLRGRPQTLEGTIETVDRETQRLVLLVPELTHEGWKRLSGKWTFVLPQWITASDTPVSIDQLAPGTVVRLYSGPTESAEVRERALYDIKVLKGAPFGWLDHLP